MSQIELEIVVCVNWLAPGRHGCDGDNRSPVIVHASYVDFLHQIRFSIWLIKRTLVTEMTSERRYFQGVAVRISEIHKFCT